MYDAGAPTVPHEVLDFAPTLGVCYGMNLIVHLLGGEIAPADRREYGRAELIVDDSDTLFDGFAEGESTPVWMSHGDQVRVVPDWLRGARAQRELAHRRVPASRSARSSACSSIPRSCTHRGAES